MNVMEELTFENKEFRKTYWHTCSHIMAQAITRLYPNAKLAIGPAIDEGWYYDIDIEESFTNDSLEAIEKEMKNICKERLPIERFVLPKDEAIELMKDQPYKLELINDIPDDEEISFYRQGEFVDLCAGPHLNSTGYVKHNGFKLLASAGAYWRGDEKNKMLKRIYGIAFQSKEELADFLNMREEARKRDHNKLGRELEYFSTVDYIGQGLPILLPKGARVV
ncbi:MAG: threonine--tRNA ligase, partial [Deltaproteobacteria bacterium]|nr:threonine--tRNA ligase [Deltaproteobacteria bacterium]